MAHSGEDFSFTWKIENFSMLPQQTGEYLESATFVAETLSHSIWVLQLYPKGANTTDKIDISIFNRIKPNDTRVQIDFSFSFETIRETFIGTKRNKTHIGENGLHNAYVELNASVLYGNKHLLLPQDVLTLKLSMWLLDEMNTAPSNIYKPIIVPNSFSKHYTSVTRMKIEKKSFTWSITKIGKLIKSRGKTSVNLKSALRNSPSLGLSFCINDSDERRSDYSKQKDSVEELDKQRSDDKDDVQNSDSGYVEVEIRQLQSAISKERLFVNCKMAVLSVDKQYQHSKQDTHLFSSNLDEIWRFPAFIIAENLVDNKYIYIDDTLLLQCDFAFSRKGAHYNAEEPQYVPWNFRNKKASKVNELNGSIRQLYLSEKFCDVSIRAGSKTFPAQKIVLCARSSVFSAMFEIDMKEKNTNVVDITDVEPDTMGRFLRFLHSDIMEENMTVEDTCKLYSAANKYQVFLLKQQCSILLLSTLSVASVCNVLVLADAHSDLFLLSVVDNFLRSHTTEAFHSDKWKSYKKLYPKLFGDIMIKIFMAE